MEEIPKIGYIIADKNGRIKITEKISTPKNEMDERKITEETPAFLHYQLYKMGKVPAIHIILTRLENFEEGKSFLPANKRREVLRKFNEKVEEIGRKKEAKIITRDTWMFGAHPKLIEKKSIFYGYKPFFEEEHKKAVEFFKKHPEYKKIGYTKKRFEIEKSKKIIFPHVLYFKRI